MTGTVILDNGDTKPINKFRVDKKGGLKKDQFKTFNFPNNNFSGIGHRKFVGDASDRNIAKGLCIRVSFLSYQRVMGRRPFVDPETVTAEDGDTSKCVVFRTK